MWNELNKTEYLLNTVSHYYLGDEFNDSWRLRDDENES